MAIIKKFETFDSDSIEERKQTIMDICLELNDEGYKTEIILLKEVSIDKVGYCVAISEEEKKISCQCPFVKNAIKRIKNYLGDKFNGIFLYVPSRNPFSEDDKEFDILYNEIEKRISLIRIDFK
jgi:hypothetical protein